MRRLLLSTAALALLVLPAMAQPESRHGGKTGDAPQAQAGAAPQVHAQPQAGGYAQSGRGNRAPAAQATIQSAAPNNGGIGRGHRDRASTPAIQAAPAAQATIQSPANRSDRGFRQGGDNRNANGRDFNRPDFNRDGRTNYSPNTRSGAGGPRHDFSGFRDYHRDFNASRRFSAPGYRRPAGWYDHRWSFGEFLPSAFWARDYWLDNFQAYDLPSPPYGAVWVRVGNDALLVDEDSGEVISVAYSVFY